MLGPHGFPLPYMLWITLAPTLWVWNRLCQRRGQAPQRGYAPASVLMMIEPAGSSVASVSAAKRSFERVFMVVSCWLRGFKRRAASPPASPTSHRGFDPFFAGTAGAPPADRGGEGSGMGEGRSADAAVA